MERRGRTLPLRHGVVLVHPSQRQCIQTTHRCKPCLSYSYPVELPGPDFPGPSLIAPNQVRHSFRYVHFRTQNGSSSGFHTLPPIFSPSLQPSPYFGTHPTNSYILSIPPNPLPAILPYCTLPAHTPLSRYSWSSCTCLWSHPHIPLPYYSPWHGLLRSDLIPEKLARCR